MKLRFLLALLLITACHAQVIPSVTAECATSIDGSVVGVPNPLQPPQVAAVYSGTLGSGNYFVEIAWYDAASHVTLVSPEIEIQLTGTGQIQVSPPSSGMPASAAGMDVYIGATSGSETLQGSIAGSATYIQSVPLVTGTAIPTTNTTLCQVIANDAGWPSGTGYGVSATTPAGQTLPGFPMQWQLLGPGGIVNVSQGLPLYNGTVQYPVPILALPYGHGPQSISGNLSLGNYSLAAGAGTFSGLVQLLDGGIISGTWSGNPTLTGNWTFTGNVTFPGLAIANNAITGTVVNTLTKLTGVPSTATITTPSDILGIVGITTAGAGSGGTASIQQSGTALCTFDGATTAGDYVVNSVTNGGDCHATAFYPQSTQLIGRVLSTNAAAGTYAVNLFATPAFPTGGQVSFAVGNGAGTGAATPICVATVSCNNGGGIVSVTTGSSPSASQTILQISFSGANSFVQSCTWFPDNSSANLATIEPQLTEHVGNGFVNLVAGTTALSGPGTTYVWDYLCNLSQQ